MARPRSSSLCFIVLAAMLAASTANADLPYEEGAVFGALRTYVRLSQDVSPESRAATRFRLPFLQTVHVGSRRTGVEGLSVEAYGFGEIEAIDPLHGNRGRADLLLATVTWRGLTDHMLTVRGGRQLIGSPAANNVILDGLYTSLALPLDLYVQGWGGFVAEPGFDEAADRWAAGARLAWNPIGAGHVAVSFAHETEYGEVARQVLGIDFSWTQIRWIAVSGMALMDLAGEDLQEIDLSLFSNPHSDWRLSADYRRYDPSARIPKTSIFSVFNNRFYDLMGGAVTWAPRKGLVSVEAAGSGLMYDDGEAGMRMRLQPKLVFNRAAGDVVGLDVGRVASDVNGYWSVRAFGAWRPIERLYLSADTEQAFYDEAQNGHSWSHVSRLGAGVDVIAGLSIRADAAVTVSPAYEQNWLGMVRIDYDLSGHAKKGVRP